MRDKHGPPSPLKKTSSQWRGGPSGQDQHVAFLADSPGKWAVHDDILEHEAASLAGWLDVE